MYLPISKAQVQCYDGAVTMRDIHSGVAGYEEPRAVYMHYY